jgi:hypothetical protein
MEDKFAAGKMPVSPLTGYNLIGHKKRPWSQKKTITKIPGLTSRYCPKCYEERKALVRRRREYTIVGPLPFDQCEKSLLVLEPRVSAGNSWWNKGPIRWLIAPSGLISDPDWFEVRAFATCKVHGRERVNELTGRRQFGRIRLWLFWVRAHIIQTLDWVIPIH